MRIITGISKGKKLKAPAGLNTRPTTDAVKEAVFSAIQFEITDSVVLDLFAGSGQLGIEALSRGAKKAYFTDISAQAVAVIRENLEKARFLNNAEVTRIAGEEFLKKTDALFDIAFLDPPYEKGLIAQILPVLIKKMNTGGIIICEHERDLTLPESLGDFKKERTYRYGGTGISVYRGGT